MKKLLMLFILSSCQENSVQPVKLQSEPSSFSSTESIQKEDDFSDLKEEKDEGCTEKEELEKKLLEESQKAFQLQGKKDDDCTVQ